MVAVQVAPSGERSRGRGRYGVLCRGNPVVSQKALYKYALPLPFTFTFCHCFDRAFLLADTCVCCVKISRNKRKRKPIGMLGRSSDNHDWLLAFVAVFVYATHATQAIAFEWKPGFTYAVVDSRTVSSCRSDDQPATWDIETRNMQMVIQRECVITKSKQN